MLEALHADHNLIVSITPLIWQLKSLSEIGAECSVNRNSYAVDNEYRPLPIPDSRLKVTVGLPALPLTDTTAPDEAADVVDG